MKQAQGTLYMIPLPIAEEAVQTLSPEILTVTGRLRHYFAENARTARRFLRLLHKDLVMETVSLSEIDKHAGPDMKLLKAWLSAGLEVGVMSESGCPGIADPGALLAAAAQQWGIPVVPLTGPNSLILALMASGLNGQHFSFHGYLPVKEPARGQKIRALELTSRKEKQTQLFIETPYRNDQLLEDLLKHCQPGTQLCIGQHLTAPNESVRTKTIADWKKEKPLLGKQPAVFLLLA